MYKIIILPLSLAFLSLASAQKPLYQDQPPKGFADMFNCPSDALKHSRMVQDSVFRANQEAYEQQYVRQMHQGVDSRSLPPLYVIPVVVHIIHAGDPLGSASNPSDATVISIVDQASDRYRHTSGASFPNNPYSGYDTEISFCMAQRTPANGATTGIERYNNPSQASPSNFNSMYTYLSGIAWNPSKYANIFIITNAPPDFQFAGVYVGDITVYVAAYFWSGLVAHEMGHYFSLSHTFEGGCPNGNCLSSGDRVCDTQPKASPGTGAGSCAAPGNSCTTDPDDPSTNNPFRPVSGGGLGDQPDILENYMDYTAPCWAAFTQGQAARMRNNIAGSRSALVTNNPACSPPPPLPLYITTFDAWSADQRMVQLVWQTEQEYGVKAFAIQYSDNGIEFESIGRIAGRNTQQPESYLFSDPNSRETGNHFYRLLQEDTDGTVSYSPIRSVLLKGGSKTKIFPTHTAGFINLSCETTIPCKVTDLTGRLLWSGMSLEKTTAIDVSRYPSGMYLLQAGAQIFKFYKQ